MGGIRPGRIACKCYVFDVQHQETSKTHNFCNSIHIDIDNHNVEETLKEFALHNL
jgi:hypothetical protein